MRRSKILGHRLVMVGILALSGCSKGPTLPSVPPTEYQGVIQGSDGLGTIDILIINRSVDPPPGSVPARGTLRLNSGTVLDQLQGSFDYSTSLLALSGSGWSLRADLSFTGSRLIGDATTANGPSTLVALKNASGPVSTYTGVEPFQAGLSILGTTVLGVARIPGTTTIVTLTGGCTAADSSLTLLDTANLGKAPVGTGRLYANGHGGYVIVHFAFATGDSGEWVGGFTTP